MKKTSITFSIFWWACIMIPSFSMAQKNPLSIPLGDPNRDSLRRVINSPGNPVLNIEALRNLAYSYIEKTCRPSQVVLVNRLYRLI